MTQKKSRHSRQSGNGNVQLKKNIKNVKKLNVPAAKTGVPERRAETQGPPMRTLDKHWKAHAFVEVINRNGSASKRYYIDLLDGYEDTDRSERYSHGIAEIDTLTFYLLGAAVMEEYVDTRGMEALFGARGIPQDPPLSHSVARIYNTLNAGKDRCQFVTHLRIGEVIAVQDRVREFMGGRPSRTIGLLLGAMRAVQDYEGPPRLVFFLERVHTAERKPLETASQYR